MINAVLIIAGVLSLLGTIKIVKNDPLPRGFYTCERCAHTVTSDHLPIAYENSLRRGSGCHYCSAPNTSLVFGNLRTPRS